ncbi:MAG: T9SS type A sorting domain-containing protein [Hymenobacteraceae bacterium]|nr:T9SS type A sorting domain-containing protein [Hymenobacteraceae bacterium]
MFQSLPTIGATVAPWVSNRWRTAALGLLLASAATVPAHAQLLYTAGAAENVAGTYTSLGAAGTAIAITQGDPDDGNSAAQPIGFSFRYNGQSFTQFVLNTNGFIKLGSAPPSAINLFLEDNTNAYLGGPLSSTEPADNNIIAPFNADLVPAGTAEFRVVTTGTAPNRVCTIQWKNVKDQITPPAPYIASAEFQVKLYEATRNIEFVYGPFTSAGSFTSFRPAIVGLKGNTDFLTVFKASIDSVQAADFDATNYDGVSAGIHFNYRPTTLPDNGRTFRFNAPLDNDINIAQLYSLGKLPIPYGVPHIVSAYIINVGVNTRASLPVILTVSGATTFTDTQTLTNVASGDSILVSFAAYTPTAAGMNTLTVTIPADDNTSNDRQQWLQEVNTSTFRYAAAGRSNGGVGYDDGSGLIAVKHTTAQSQSVLSTRVYLDGEATIGRTVYGVVLDDGGNILARSANYVVMAADTGSYKTFNFPTQPTIPVGDFYVALAQTAATPGYFPVGTQQEAPSRVGAYFAIPLTGGTPTDITDFGLTLRPMIEAVLGAPAACQAPGNLAVAGITSAGATVTFAAVTGAQSYLVFYGPTGFTPGGAGSQQQVTTTTSVTLSGLTPTTAYDVYVRAVCSATSSSVDSGPVSFTTSCVAPLLALPYAENFDALPTGELPCGWTILNLNGDTVQWRVRATSFANSAPHALSIRYTDNAALAEDDWAIMPGVQLAAGEELRVMFGYRGGSTSFTEKLEVKVGNAPTVAALTSTIFTNDNIVNVAYETATGSFVAPAAGTYYVGYHAFSAGDQFRIAIDDIELERRVVGVNNSAAARAVNVYPNPSAGQLNVQITESGATRVALRVLDNLGRVVYTATMRDNAVKTLDLTTLSNGLYTVQVILDDQIVTKQVSVRK